MTRARDIRRIRTLLQQRRRDLLQTALAARDEVAALKAQDRDAEFEENAQVELADYTLSNLMEGQRRELQQIDGALARMDRDEFGSCVDCGTVIPLERLAAVPFAIRCGDCAADQEQRAKATRGTQAMPTL